MGDQIADLAAFYSLDAVEREFGFARKLLFEEGARRRVSLCIPVPPGGQVLVIDPYSTDTKDGGVEQARFLSKKRPMESGIPYSPAMEIIALILSARDCANLLAGIDFAKIMLFEAGYIDISGFGPPSIEGIKIDYPGRPPFFNEDGTASRGSWKFAIYPSGTRFYFAPDVGYQSPTAIELSPERLRIAGAELAKLLAQQNVNISTHANVGAVDKPFQELVPENEGPDETKLTPEKKKTAKGWADPIKEELMELQNELGRKPTVDEAMDYFIGRASDELSDIISVKGEVVRYRTKGGLIKEMNEKKLKDRIRNLKFEGERASFS